MDSDEDTRLSDVVTPKAPFKGKGKVVDIGAPDSESLPWYDLDTALLA
jgi:hypothetical protein